jgi:murein DD-endopeptidase MepM/ murein hydrolase activator NlpD
MRFGEPSGSRTLARCFAVALVAAGAAGCSDSKRVGENAWSNPFARREAASQTAPADAAPIGRVEAQPLGAQSAAPLPPSPDPTHTYYPPRDTTGSLATDAPASSGDVTITVATGDTVDAIARRYGVSSAAIVRANHLPAAGSIQAGQTLVIPQHASPRRRVASAPKPHAPVHHAATRAAPGGVHTVGAGETLSSVARRYRQSRSAIAKVNDLAPDAKLKVGQQLTIPAAKSTRVAAGPPAPSPAASANARVPAAAPAHSQPPQRVATAEAGAPLGAAEPPAARIDTPTDSTNAAGGFRWPVRGRVISGYGQEANGQRNDGINLAVPEGTSVKAAEEGTVAYAGNELKGYGNLVLVRHSNGFVTAYAHASELMVKRGDQVKRGQIIARAGQTGAVSSPQLHFEIRKGATPVDPMRYLSGTEASSASN